MKTARGSNIEKCESLKMYNHHHRDVRVVSDQETDAEDFLVQIHDGAETRSLAEYSGSSDDHGVHDLVTGQILAVQRTEQQTQIRTLQVRTET